MEDSFENSEKRSLVVCLGVLLWCCGIVLTTGCIRPPVPSNQGELIAYRGFHGRKERPFSLTVQDDIRQDDTVHVLLELRGHRAWKPSEIGFRVITFAQGEEVATHLFPGEKVITLPADTKEFAPETDQEVVISFKSGSFAHYQLELLWGAERSAVLTAKPLASQVQTVKFEIRRIQLREQQPCTAGTSCLTRFVVEGAVRNEGTVAVAGVTLGVRYVPDGKQKAGAAEGKEQEVPLSSLTLAPGQSRTIRMTIGKGLPKAVATALRPEIRVLASGQ